MDVISIESEKEYKNADHFYEIDNHIYSLMLTGNFQELKRVILEDYIVDNLTMMGMPLIFYAVKKGNKEFTKFLLECGSDINLYNTSFRATPIFAAVKSSTVDMVQFVIDCGGNPHIENGDGYTLLGYAVTCHRMDMFEYLIDLKTPMNEHSDIIYCIKNNAKYLKKLFEKNVIDIHWKSKNNESIYELAQLYGNKTVLKFLDKINEQKK